MVNSTVITEMRGNTDVIIATGQLDNETYKGLKKAVDGLLEQKKYKIAIDLSGVEYMCSAAWGTITGSLKAARQNLGDIVVAGMSEDLKSVFELIELGDMIKSYSTLEEAVKSL